jgi:hypothetical protein
MSCAGHCSPELVFSLFVSSLTEPFEGEGVAFLGSSGFGYNAGVGAGRSPPKEALKSIGAVATRGSSKQSVPSLSVSVMSIRGCGGVERSHAWEVKEVRDRECFM